MNGMEMAGRKVRTIAAGVAMAALTVVAPLVVAGTAHADGGPEAGQPVRHPRSVTAPLSGPEAGQPVRHPRNVTAE